MLNGFALEPSFTQKPSVETVQVSFDQHEGESVFSNKNFEELGQRQIKLPKGLFALVLISS